MQHTEETDNAYLEDEYTSYLPFDDEFYEAVNDTIDKVVSDAITPGEEINGMGTAVL
ncbi:hypothetical protein NDU88_005492, partial [Pleurodeles waltl]